MSDYVPISLLDERGSISTFNPYEQNNPASNWGPRDRDRGGRTPFYNSPTPIRRYRTPPRYAPSVVPVQPQPAAAAALPAASLTDEHLKQIKYLLIAIGVVMLLILLFVLLKK